MKIVLCGIGINIHLKNHARVAISGYNRCGILSTPVLSGQYLCMKTMILQQPNEQGRLHRTCRTLYTQYPVTVLQVKIGLVSHEGPVYLFDQHIGMIRMADIGFKYFYHAQAVLE